MSSYMWVYPKGDQQLFRTLNVLSPSVPTSWEYIVAYSIDQGGGTIWRSNTLQVLKTTKTFTLYNQVYMKMTVYYIYLWSRILFFLDLGLDLSLHSFQWQLTSYGCSGTALVYYFQHVTVALMSTPS